MSELQRLKSLLPPENESWVFIEAAIAIDPPLITLEEIGRDEVEIQIDLEKWDNFALDHRNLLFWHEVGKIQNDIELIGADLRAINKAEDRKLFKESMEKISVNVCPSGIASNFDEAMELSLIHI